MVTGVLGYYHARNALERAVFDQLTTVRKTKARQVEAYFRTISSELRLLASSKMAADATRAFRIEVAKLDRGETSPEFRRKVSDWYVDEFHARHETHSRQRSRTSLDYLPVGAAPYDLQYHYIVSNPQLGGPAKSARRCRRRQRLQQSCTQSIIRFYAPPPRRLGFSTS